MLTSRHSAPIQPASALRVHVLFESQDLATPNGASYLRLIRPLEHPSNRATVDLSVAATLPDTPIDVVIIDRLWYPNLTADLQDELFETLSARQIPLVYSLDDDLFSEPDTDTRPSLPGPQQRLRVRRFLLKAAGTIVSTDELARRIARLTRRAIVLPNQLDERLFPRQAAPIRKQGPICFGYMGTRTHLQDLLMILHPLRRFLADSQGKVRFEIIGIADETLLESLFDGAPVTIREVPRDAIRYPEFMEWTAANLGWDFAIAPLCDDRFNAAKSDLKLLDYGVLGIPAIFSRTPNFSQSVHDGQTGLLADNSAEAWYDALTRMAEDLPLRERLSAQVKDYVWTQRTLAQHATTWPRVLRALIAPDVSVDSDSDPDILPAARAPAPTALPATQARISAAAGPDAADNDLLAPEADRSERNGAQQQPFFWRRALHSSRRRDNLLYFVDMGGKGLEVGPSFSPIAPKRLGYDVDVVDHATADELRAKYRDRGVDLAAIEEVDYIWTGSPLTDLLGDQPRYDYIIASHLVEHLPDLIGFFSDCERLLRPNGVLSLAIPDFRACFDLLRGPSTTGDLLQAHHEGRRRHAMGTVFDHFATTAYRNGQPSWPLDAAGSLEFAHRFDQAQRMLERACTSNDYIDVHAWRFTPSSFRLLMYDLRALNRVSLHEVGGFLTPDGAEFLVALQIGHRDTDDSRLQLAQSALHEWGSLDC